MNEKLNTKILILDGQTNFKIACREKLFEAGFRNIEMTDDPKTAIDYMKKEAVDIVVFDVVLNEIDGVEFMRRVSVLNLKGDPKFITCSAIVNDAIVSKMISLGVDYYMKKPLSVNDLVERISLFIAEKQTVELPGSRTVYAAPSSFSEEELEFELEKRVTSIISEIGVPAHIKGFSYARSAIIMTVKNPDMINAVTKVLYPSVAKMYSTSPSRVERAIRHSIEVAWGRGNIETLDEIFGYSIDDSRGKPTNSEFIAIIADLIRHERREFRNLSEKKKAA